MKKKSKYVRNCKYCLEDFGAETKTKKVCSKCEHGYLRTEEFLFFFRKHGHSWFKFWKKAMRELSTKEITLDNTPNWAKSASSVLKNRKW